MSKIINYNIIRITGHAVFWLISLAYWMILFYLANPSGTVLTTENILKNIILNSTFAISVYINLYLLIPRFFVKKNYVFYGFWLILLLAASSVLIQVLFIYPFHSIFNNGQFTAFSPAIYSRYFFVTLLYVGITSVLKFIKEWFLLQDLKYKYEQSERKKLEAELKTLKGQVHPHFLFNSLNNVYSLSLTNPDKVPGFILKLSDLLRHAIYESRKDFISLRKELTFIKNYVSLQKIRIPQAIKVNYSIQGKVPDKKIPPLLLEPFVDNAFKHGLTGQGDQYVSIHFDFTLPGILLFSIENTYEESLSSNTEYKGIGLENVKKRLKHLYADNQYNLEIQKDQTRFKVTLKLNLKE